MEQIIKVSQDSYESIAHLLNKTVDNLNLIGEPYWIILDDKKYLVSSKEDIISIVSNDDDIIVLNEKDTELEKFYDNCLFYRYKKDETGVLASIDSTLYKRCEELYLLYPSEKLSKPILRYVQSMDNSYLTYDYDLSTHLNNYESYLEFIARKNPAFIRYAYEMMLLRFMSHCKYTDYYLNEEDDTYSPCIISIDGFLRLVNHYKTYNKEDLMQAFVDVGYKETVPPRLISMLNGTDQRFQEIAKIRKMYQNRNNH